MVSSLWFIAIVSFAAVALATLAIALLIEVFSTSRRRKDVLRRLESADPFAEPEAEKATTAGLLRKNARSRANGEPTLLDRLPHVRDVAIMIEQAGLNWTVRTYLIGVFGLAIGAGVAVFVVSGAALVSLACAAAASTIPYFILRHKRTKRIAAFEEQLPEAIDLLGRAIRAGHPLSAGIRMVSEDGPEPVAAEFRQVFEEQRFGLPFEDALLGIADRVDLVDVRILVTAILIQREVGGNLAEILDKIAQTIRARFAIRRQLRTYTAQGRLSGYVLGAMPFVVGFAIFFLDREYVMLLFEEPVGRLMVTAAVIMQLFGYLWIRKVVNIEI